MHKITYQNHMKTGKCQVDFQIWLNQYWATQKSWGAQDVRFWTKADGGSTYLFSQYLVEHLDQWIDKARRAQTSPIIRELEQICACSKITIEPITL